MEPRWYRFFGTTQNRLYPRRKLFKRKRLDQIIVRACEQQIHFLFLLRTRGKDKNGKIDALGAHLSADIHAAHARQHEIQNDEVVIISMERNTGVPFDAVIYGIDSIALVS